MHKTNGMSVLLLLILGTGLVFGLVQLWSFRFAVGDLHPAYSSLRADPLGVKALYEALTGLPETTVLRHYKRLAELPSSPSTTLLLLGLPADYFDTLPEEDQQALDAFVQHGGRLVLAFAPVRASLPASQEPVGTQERADENLPADESVAATSPPPTLAQHWEVAITTWPFAWEQATRETATRFAANADFPAQISLYTTTVVQPLAPVWHILYGREQHPVLVTRSLGQGSIILSADTYLFSNEALRSERHTALLTWILATSRTIVFDETHLGSQEETGVMTLIRKYRLHGALLGFLVLALLFVWQHTTSLVPPLVEAAETACGDTVAGHSTHASLVNLLQRHIARDDLLQVCLTEWRKSLPQESKRIAMQNALKDHQQARSTQRLVETYRTLCHIAQTKGM